jgi:soluble lytic murein transglycosylase-like protein
LFVAFPSQLLALARKAADAQSLDPGLVCAVVEQESSWNPWAMRYEPAFFTKYVAPLYTNNKVSASEAYARGFSWGLMQVMGQVARETGFEAVFLSVLCDPEQGLAIGCKVLRRKFDAAGGDATRALLAWNGGANALYVRPLRQDHFGYTHAAALLDTNCRTDLRRGPGSGHL